MEEKYTRLLESLNKCVRMVTYPVGIKLITNVMGEVERPKGVRPVKESLGHRACICQCVTLARRFGFSLVLEQDDYACPPSAVYMGYYPEDTILQGKNAMGGYCIDAEAGKPMEHANPALPLGLLKELWIAPLEKAKFDPDIVVVHGNAAQIARLIHAENYLDGRGIPANNYARAACSAYITKAFLNKDCQVLIPSGGERVFGMAQDDELVFAIPSNRVEDIITGLEATHKVGLVRYPTPYQGLMAEPTVPEKYWKVIPPEARPEEFRDLESKDK